MNNVARNVTLSYQDFPINLRPDTGWISLTDMWKAQGSSKNKEPKYWLRHDGTQDLIRVLAKGDFRTPLASTARSPAL